MKTDTQNINNQAIKWQEGERLFKSGQIEISSNTYFMVEGYKVKLNPISCKCRDHKKTKTHCQHIYATLNYILTMILN